MEQCETIESVRLHLDAQRAAGKRITFVPTMGALHEGHLSLIDAAREDGGFCVASVFINPIQFNETRDFEKYPRTFEQDAQVLADRGCDLLFAPTTDVLYPSSFDTTLSCGILTTRLEGAHRPGHFDGVTTVVAKLFNSIMPDSAFFGQKDAQQVLVIKKMVQDMNFPIRIRVIPTVRDDRGLALSSRNSLLTEKEYRIAPLIYRGLQRIQSVWSQGERSSYCLLEEARALYGEEPLIHPEYIAITDRLCRDLDQVPAEGALVSTACRMGESGVRLIDNIVLGGFFD